MSVACYLVLAICAFTAVATSPLLVPTETGDVLGFALGKHNIWLGIPYAAPPVGILRWQPPQPHAHWAGTHNATKYGSICPQPGSSEQSEDCLFLNIFAPNENLTNLPVLVWIHGGAYIKGSSSGFSGIELAGDSLIVVTINYRLGALGFLGLPELLAANRTTGFYGIQDQRAALAWVKNNIAKFGGDPSLITVSGQSAGAISACVHLAAPRSAPYINRVLMESGFCNVWSQAQSYQIGQEITTRLKCSGSDVLSCIRDKSLAEVLTAGDFNLFMPMVHDYELADQPHALIQQGKYNHVPVLAGTNLDENAAWGCGGYLHANDTQYLGALVRCFGKDAAPYIYKFYDPSNYSNPVDALVAATTRATFTCPTMQMADGVSSATSGAAIYVYSFQNAPSWSTAPDRQCMGAYHGSEMVYVWGTATTSMTNQETILETDIKAAWTSFITSGVPVFKISSLVWDKYDTRNRASMVFGQNRTIEIPNQFADECNFWSTLQRKFPETDMQQGANNCFVGFHA